MARARTKSELLDFGEKEFKKLMEYSNKYKDSKSETQYIFDNRTAKDILSHLEAWYQLVFNWYQVGMKGEKPEIPAPGYTFKTAPELNEKLFQEYKDIKWEEIIKRLTTSHNKLMEIIKNHSEDELETKKKYKWTGTTNMASYFASVSSSHYVWASDLLRKHLNV